VYNQGDTEDFSRARLIMKAKTEMNRGRLAPLLLFAFVLFDADASMIQRRNAKPTPTGGELYLVMKNRKFGYINGEGHIVIKPRYALASPFSEGLAAVMIRGEKDKTFTAYIDKTGRVVIKPVEGSGGNFSSGVASLLSGGSYLYIDSKGRWASLASYQNAEDCTEGLCAVRMDPLGPKRWGYINTSGAVVVKGQYDWAKPFKEGIARVGIMIGEPYTKDGAPAHDGKEGYVDKSGRPITELKFEKAWDFSDGMAQVRVNGKWGYIDKTGTIVISPQYDETGAFREGLAAVKINGLWGFINKAGKLVIATQFDYVDGFSEGLAVVGRDGKSYYIDQNSNAALSPPFKGLGAFKSGLATFRQTDRMGVLDKTGKIILDAQFNSIEILSGGIIRVEEHKKGIGYADRTGKFFWEPSY
jgi:hypothetical protein